MQLHNTDTDVSMNDVFSEISLPPGLSLGPPSQQTMQYTNPPSLTPGQSATLSWRIRVDPDLVQDSVLTIYLPSYYMDPKTKQSCVASATECATSIVIKHVPSFSSEVMCSLSSPDTIRVDASGHAMDGLPFTLRSTLTNTGTASVATARARLSIPGGFTLKAVPSSDTVRNIASLAPGAQSSEYWTLSISPRTYVRTAHIRFFAEDSLGNLLSYCEKEIVIDPITQLACNTSGDDHLSYNAHTQTYTPDSLSIRFQLENPIDTALAVIMADIDFVHAPHLALRNGQNISQAPFPLPGKFRRSLSWTLIPQGSVSGTVTDTVSVRYKIASAPMEEICMMIVTIREQSEQVECSIQSLDSLLLTADGITLQPNPFDVVADFRNTGSTVVNAKEAILAFSGLQTNDPLTQTMAAIDPLTTQSRTWEVNSRRSHCNTDARIQVILIDQSDNELTRCEKTIFIPRIDDDVTCTLTAPDSILYNVVTDTYTPNSFTTAIELTNHVDTTQTKVETEIDLNASPHIALRTGETALKQIPDFDTQQSAQYALVIAGKTDNTITEQITIRYRNNAELQWRSCSKSILIQGEKRIQEIACAVRGQDTLWSDAHYEEVIPLSLQVEYTVTNTGNVPLDACEAAIILPYSYELIHSADSIQSYGTIQPGQTIARDWLATLNKDNAQPGTSTITWAWSCKDMQAPACNKLITVVIAPPPGIVFTPWKLHFMAKQNAALPAAQQVTLWPGNGASIFWQASAKQSWLDYQPTSGADKSVIDVQPNTTNLPLGRYYDDITITSGKYVAPSKIEGDYLVYDLTGSEAPPAATTLSLEQNYPNPATGETMIGFTLPEAQHITLTLYDMYGRKVMRLFESTLEAGRSAVKFDVSSLSAGMYCIVLQTPAQVVTQALVVR